jgi:hypothetical protein
MTPRTPSGGQPRFAGLGQRLLSLLVLGAFAYLVWLALSGRFDHEVNRVARWLQATFGALTR